MYEESLLRFKFGSVLVTREANSIAQPPHLKNECKTTHLTEQHQRTTVQWVEHFK